MQSNYHTKIYGTGIKDVLAQAEISGSYTNGVLKIELNKDQSLVITATGDGILHFSIESTKSPMRFSY